MSQQQHYDDPFATSERHPSLSFKDKPIGTRYVCKVVERPNMVQARDFETGERATWDDGNPKMTVVTGVEVNGERMSLWAPKPSAMFAAMGEAQQQAGAQIAPGGTLTVEYVGDKPNEKNPRLNAAKQYRVTYEPPSAFDTGQPGGAAASGAGGQASSEPPF
jgi:hypothetical protein